MNDVAYADLRAGRWVWFVQTLTFFSRDFTGATLKMQIRAMKDTTGTPLISLTNAVVDTQGIELAYAGTATIAAHISAGRLSEVPDATNPATGVPYVSTDSVTISILRVVIDSANVAAMPFPEELGEDAEFYYDLVVDLPVGVPEVVMAGKFIVVAGVTIP